MATGLKTPATRQATLPTHVGRSFNCTDLEDECPCPQEPCGLVDLNKVDPECQQHPVGRAKTIRQGHRPEECAAVVAAAAAKKEAA